MPVPIFHRPSPAPTRPDAGQYFSQGVLDSDRRNAESSEMISVVGAPQISMPAGVNHAGIPLINQWVPG